ncbi:MAG TPA: hypothetical protein VK699_13775 [Terriglobales bacterium]|jgi:hypothetical protein|nr:hypothetical protein [Terriglobales bacterium]
MNAELKDEIVIRPASPGDEEGILRCLAAAFEPYQGAYTPDAFADTILTPERLAARLQQMHVLVAAAPEGIVGTIAGSFHGAEGHLRGMAVLPYWRGTGLAVKFYEKNGYRRSGKIADFFGMPLIEYLKSLS